MLTVAGLLDELGLEASAASSAADGREIRWVHISELEDPTPWLAGGELLLTTGLNLTDESRQRKFVRGLAERGLAGVGFGSGFDHEAVPAALLEEAEKLELPVFEVPYEMPFIAVTEKAFTRLVNEQFGVLERSVEVHEQLERLVLAGRGLGAIIKEVAEAVSGAALLLDDRGRELARHPSERGISKAATAELADAVIERVRDGRRVPFAPEDGPLAERALAVPVPIDSALGGCWLVVAKRTGSIGDLERLLARQAAMVVALELMRERAVRETERRLAGDVLAEALGGRLGAEELRGRLSPFGIEGRVAVLVFELEPSVGDADLVSDSLSSAGGAALVAVNAAAGKPLLCAIVDPGERDPVDLAREARGLLARDGRAVRAAASRAVGIEALRRAFHEARCALEATAMANGTAPEVATYKDLGAFTLLLSIQDDDALRAYADNLLGPIEQGGEGDYGPELLRSLEAFIDRHGAWERAARDLFCHRHTLRYRIKRIEELTGRDLDHAQDRIELWLALRARELVR